MAFKLGVYGMQSSEAEGLVGLSFPVIPRPVILRLGIGHLHTVDGGLSGGRGRHTSARSGTGQGDRSGDGVAGDGGRQALHVLSGAEAAESRKRWRRRLSWFC
ncbi:hypothetical protein [Spirillospora sp. NPDC048819]|uniref:hypothetical protein n=1 Tax=Spirillospora sp. NPDC048819 TaxID=3155268 RepID=UPI0033EF5E98